MLGNYFAAESAIISRIKTSVTEFRDVIGTGGILQDDPSAFCPLAQVNHGGFTIKDYKGGELTLITQKWIVAVIVESPDDRDGSMARAEASPLIVKVIKALVGWKPGADFSAMALAGSHGDLYTDGGITIFPIEFTTNATI